MTNPRPDTRLSCALLVQFSDGLGWREILALDTLRSRGWWRDAVAEAEANGEIEWSGDAWRLTDEGRRRVARTLMTTGRL